MKTKKKPKASSSPSQNPNSQPPDYPTSIATIAVTQICQSVGYKGAQSSALQTLTAVAVNYLQSLAKSATMSSCSTGRTQSNLYDVVCALENLHSNLGFQGNSDPKRRLYFSSILCDIMNFVKRSREIPFAKPLPKRHRIVMPIPPCFDGNGDKWNHIPRWLPAFPKVINGKEAIVGEETKGEFALKKMCSAGVKPATGKLPEKRKKISFKIGHGGSHGNNVIKLGFGGDLRSGVCKRGKRILCQIYEDDDNNGNISSNNKSNSESNVFTKNKLEEGCKRWKTIMMS